jgi:hypothetical protein
MAEEAARVTVPGGYWGDAKLAYHYYRDHVDSGAWGVRHKDGRIVAVGLDKSVAAAIACLLNGHVVMAQLFLQGMSEQLFEAIEPKLRGPDAG